VGRQQHPAAARDRGDQRPVVGAIGATDELQVERDQPRAVGV
jgi:hypothetical protein